MVDSILPEVGQAVKFEEKEGGKITESIRLLNRNRPCGAEKNARQLDVAGFICQAP